MERLRTVAIGESGEYGVRLARFLESHLSRECHIVRCTDVEQFLEEVSKDAYCIVAKEFAQKMEGIYPQVILLGERANEFTFCRYHSPVKLVEQIEQYFQVNAAEQARNAGAKATLVAVYTPVYVAGMREIALQYMREGSLCLGMEDLGEMHKDEANMSEVCYYIHLRKEDITRLMQQMMEMSAERYFISSPDLYYDLADLSLEDFTWFFEKVREMAGYGTIYVLMGSAAVKSVEVFRNFDQIIMVSKKHHRKLSRFWEAFQQALESYHIRPERGLSTIYQEDVQ